MSAVVGAGSARVVMKQRDFVWARVVSKVTVVAPIVKRFVDCNHPACSRGESEADISEGVIVCLSSFAD